MKPFAETRFVKAIISFGLAIASLFCSIFGLPTYPHGKTVDMDRFELVWSDEFDTFDAKRWEPGSTWMADSTGSTVRNGGYWNPKMCTIEGGMLHIATKYYPDESWAGPSIETNTEAPTDFIVDYVRAYQYK